MSDSTVIKFMENAGKSMTFEEGFAFIERSRRQLDRFSVLNPGIRIVPEDEADLRAGLDRLEADWRGLQGHNQRS